MQLSVLIADTGLWASPEVHRRLLAENSTGAFFPNARRARKAAGEARGRCGNDLLDDNSYANHAIKQAIGIRRECITGFETCHIWPQSCYDARYHTVVANLVLLPSPLAGLSDHDPGIQAALKFRAYELYGWRPEEFPAPSRPEFYPTQWAEPMPFTADIERAIRGRKL